MVITLRLKNNLCIWLHFYAKKSMVLNINTLTIIKQKLIRLYMFCPCKLQRTSFFPLLSVKETEKECVVVIFLLKCYFSQKLCLFIAVHLPFSSDTTLGLDTILWQLHLKYYLTSGSWVAQFLSFQLSNCHVLLAFVRQPFKCQCRFTAGVGGHVLWVIWWLIHLLSETPKMPRKMQL